MSLPDPHARIVSLERELAWANLKIQSLMEELRQFRVKLLGPKSETLNDLQLELLADQEPGTTLDEVEAESKRAPLAAAPPRERKRHPGRQRLPENLERVEEVVSCAEQTCRQCGAETAVIGYDESEQLDVVPARHSYAGDVHHHADRTYRQLTAGLSHAVSPPVGGDDRMRDGASRGLELKGNAVGVAQHLHRLVFVQVHVLHRGEEPID